MKKLVVFAVVSTLVMITACNGNKVENNSTCDSDTVCVDTIIIDSCCSINLDNPEWNPDSDECCPD